MKRYIPFFLIAAAAMVVFIACKKDYPVHAPFDGVQGMAFLKIVHAAPHFDSIFKTPDNINVYVGADKINGAPLKFNSAFPGIVNTYASVKAGDQQIRLSLGGVVNPDSGTFVTLNKTLAPDNYYTLIITDSIKSPRDSSQIWLHDVYPKPTQGPGYFYLRFVHAVWDTNPTDTMELLSKRRGQLLFQKVPRNTATAFTYFPTLLNTLDTLYVRNKNTKDTLGKLLLTAPFGDQQFYTMYLIGDTAKKVAAKTTTLVYYPNK